MTRGSAAVESRLSAHQHQAVLSPPSLALTSLATPSFSLPLAVAQLANTRNALRVIATYEAETESIEQHQFKDAFAEVTNAVDMQLHDGGIAIDVDDDDVALTVDPELVRGLVQSGSADVIVAEQAAKAMLRRSKHRESMIRYRRKKKRSVEDMKAKEQRLAAQLQKLLHVHSDGAAVDVDSTDNDDAALPLLASASKRATHAQETLDDYVEVLTLKERLHHENALLRHRLADLHKFATVVHETHANTADDEAAARKKQAARQFEQPGGRWVRFREHDEPFYFVPFERAECCAIASATLGKIYEHQSLYLMGSTAPPTAVAKLFGWTARLQFEWDDDVQLTMIRFQFTKTFRNPQRSVAQLVDDEWRIFTDDTHFVHIHRVPVRSQMLQRVDDNMTVRLWNAPTPNKSLRFRNVSLFTRSRYTSPLGQDCGIVTVTGVRLKHFREQELMSLDEFCKKHMTADGHDGSGSDSDHSDDDGNGNGPAVYTHGGFVYTTFVNDERGDMEVEFGGRVDITSEQQGRFLMVELGGTCVRIEHLLFPSRVIKWF